jgi:hypothetical protein
MIRKFLHSKSPRERPLLPHLVRTSLSWRPRGAGAVSDHDELRRAGFIPSEHHPGPFTDQLRLAVAAYLARFKPKLRPIRHGISGLNWDFAVVAGWRSGYLKVSGIGTPRSSKACRWAEVGSASIAMVTSVPA